MKAAVGFAVTFLLMPTLLALGQQAPQTRLLGQRPDVTRSLQPLGRLDGATRLKLSIHLPLRNREALTNFIDRLYDPSSPDYRHYLAPEEFDARFGPTEQDYQSVIAWATANGFAMVARHPNRMLLEVTAPVSVIERGLGVVMRTYRHPTEPRTFFAPDDDPLIAAGIPVGSISGLDDFARPKPKLLRRSPIKTSAQATPKAGSRPTGILAGFDYRAAYAPGISETGTGQMIGLVEFDGFYAADITSYVNQTGLPNVPLQIVLLDGFNGVPTPGTNSGNGEVALDIEMAISMAPGLAKVVVFEADPVFGIPNDVLQAMSTNASIKQLSCSWSFGPLSSADRNTMDGYFMKFAAQGQSFFDASGDNGAASGPIPAPDDDPYITVVGGTTLATTRPASPWLSETVWNAQEGPGFNSSGGGVSSRYGIPTWQQGVNMATNNGSTIFRNCPDVAMVADNIFIVADNGHQEVTGGTSASAPLWAGFAALANQRAVAASLPTIGFINPALYQIATSPGYLAAFDDVTVGNNTNNFNATRFLAAPGYDLCTGWGSPSGGSLIIALTQPDGFQITPGRGAVANGPVGGPFTVSAQTLSLANVGMPAFNWSLTSTSSWLTVSANGGTLTSGTGATPVSLKLNPAANLLPAGLYTANLFFTNLTSGLGQLRQFTLQVGQDLVQDGGFEAGDFCYWTLSGDGSVFTNNFVDDGTYSTYSPEAGFFFAALGQVANLGSLSQPLATQAGQPYLLSLWLENPSGSVPNQFVVRWNSGSTATNTLFNQVNMGAFGWTNLLFTVQASTGPSTLQFSFRSDNDFLALDQVSVLPIPLPAVQASESTISTVQLVWPALAGAQYQLQYKTNLMQANWVNLGGVITATGSSVSYSENISPDPSRFYRVQLLVH
jgi:hypothetical protein